MRPIVVVSCSQRAWQVVQVTRLLHWCARAKTDQQRAYRAYKGLIKKLTKERDEAPEGSHERLRAEAAIARYEASLAATQTEEAMRRMARRAARKTAARLARKAARKEPREEVRQEPAREEPRRETPRVRIDLTRPPDKDSR
jgi:hypothetical protein